MNSNTRVLGTTILMSGMVFIDGSAVNVALPAIQAGFRANVPATPRRASIDRLQDLFRTNP